MKQRGKATPLQRAIWAHQEALESEAERGRREATHSGGVTAFGETKSLAEWTVDHRCSVSAATLCNRLGRGTAPEEAITTPQQGYKAVEAFGEIKSVRAWSKDPRCKVCLDALHRRLRDGIPPETAMTNSDNILRRPRQGEKHEGFGESKTLRQWAVDSRCQVTLRMLRKRVGAGVPIERALLDERIVPELPLYAAFGESKTLPEWVRDPRCKASYFTILARLKRGVPFAFAIRDTGSAKSNTRSRVYLAFGVEKTLADWARDPRCQASIAILRRRLERGMSLEEAIRTPPENQATYEAFGEAKMISEWVADPRAKIRCRNTLIDRMAKGATFEEALTRPQKENYRARYSIVLTAFGETKSMTEWVKDERCTVSRSELARRLEEGQSPEEAFQEQSPFIKHERYSAFGEEKMMSEWARDPRCLVPLSTLRYRVVVAGEPMESAMSWPADIRLKPIWDIEKFSGDGRAALELEAARFKVVVTPQGEIIETAILPSSGD